MKIAIIEDEPKIAESLKLILMEIERAIQNVFCGEGIDSVMNRTKRMSEK